MRAKPHRTLSALQPAESGRASLSTNIATARPMLGIAIPIVAADPVTDGRLVRVTGRAGAS
jgi:hypothetical protein